MKEQLSLWFHANAVWFVPLAVGALWNFANGLLKSPNENTKKAGRALRWVLDTFSIVTNKDAAGTFKLPVARSKRVRNGVKISLEAVPTTPPSESPTPPEPPKGA